jgi:hypothetical protein
LPIPNSFPHFGGFTYSTAIPPEEGVTRRNLSLVIRVEDAYYVWYSRTTQSVDGYSATRGSFFWLVIADDKRIAKGEIHA